ncbi:MAG: chloride channel protein [Acidimicrobiia bacterium]|nr:chloride channel protein [Acidimicrobiia bacterium]
MIPNPARLRGFAQRSWELLGASALVGIVTGLLVAGAEKLTLNLLEWVQGLPVWAVVAAPAVGLVLAALALRYLAFRAAPGLADTWLRAFHDPNEDMKARTAPGGVVASLCTIGFGGAMGLEGLSIFTGGAVGTVIQDRLRWLFGSIDAKVLMTAGAAAGVAAIFKAPATGALFAIEVPFTDDFAPRKLLPCLVAGATGYLGFAAVNGTTPLFEAHGHVGFEASTLIGALGLGVVGGLGARLFSRLIGFAKSLTRRYSLPVRIAGAAATTAALLVVSRLATGRNLTLGPGYDAISWALKPNRAVPVLLLILVLRCLATAAATAGGGAGGLFIPLVVAGALLGRATGNLFGRAEDTMFLIVGIAAFLGAGYRVPLTAVMFVAETSGRATYVVPALLAAVVADLMMGKQCVTAYQRSRIEPASA